MWDSVHVMIFMEGKQSEAAMYFLLGHEMLPSLQSFVKPLLLSLFLKFLG